MATIIMRRNKNGQFVARKSNPARKKKHPRKNPFVGAAPVLAALNPKKKHRKHHPHMFMMNKKRRPRHNPKDFKIPGFGNVSLPSVGEVVGVTGGIVGPSLVRGGASVMAPSFATSNPTIMEVAAYAVPLAAGYLIDGKAGLQAVAVGEIAAFLAKTIANAATGAGIPATTQGTTLARMIGPVARRGSAFGGMIGPVNRRTFGGHLTANRKQLGAGRFNNRADRFNSRF